jgi:cationic peptide transport system permease protein
MTAGLIGYAVPVFWLALLVVMFFSLELGWLPASGQISLLYDVPSITGIAVFDVLMSNEPWRQAALHDALLHLILPSLVLAVVPTTEVIRHVRSSLIDVMKQNYIKAATSRGLSKAQIVWRHGLKNALPPVLPLLGLQLGSVLTSAMITEVVFEWHGIGRWLINSIALQDYAAIPGATLVVAGFVIVISVSTELLTTLIYPARRKELYAKQD